MSRELEMHVIGGILLGKPDDLEKAFSMLTPKCFQSEFLASVYRNMRRQYRETGEITVAGAITDASADGIDDPAGMIRMCMDVVATGAALPYHAALLFGDYRKRLIADGASKLLTNFEADVSAEELISDLRKMAEVQSKLDEIQGGETSMSMLDSIVEYLNCLYSAEKKPMRTGIAGVDYVLGGFHKKRLYAISGRSGMGKSDFSVYVAMQLASKGHKVLYLSMEMTRQEIMGRIASSLAMIDGDILGDPDRCTPDQIAAVSKCLERVSKLPLVLDEQQEITQEDIYRKIRQHHPDVVFIDHIQLMKQDPYKKYWENAFETSKMMKRCAMNENIAIVELVQQNADVEKRKNKAALLSDLKGSDGIGNDADSVIFISAEKTENPLSGSESFEAKLEIVKNRQGKTGTVPFRWQPQYHRYIQVDTRRGT